MNNLVISIVAIALVMILAGVGAFYGGDIFKSNQVDASVARYLNESSQLNSAVTLFQAEGNEITANFEIHQLVEEEYLTTIPEGWEKIPGTLGVSIPNPESVTGFAEEVCFEANKKMGFEFNAADTMINIYSKDETKGIPMCDKDMDGLVPCCIL
ncbi:hypothetical protein LMH73_011670 [Vibrio splendidus]|nr:hypothetical protein [Vibrio splendidus]MCC4883046.1 hypothetical protein [Vibrio splendidus]